MVLNTSAFGAFTRMLLVAAMGLSACGGGAPAAPRANTGQPSSQPSPPVGAPTWEWILQASGLPATPVQVTYLDVDGFDTPAAYVRSANARGIKTICYISVGTAEDFRFDFVQFRSIPNVVGRPVPGFPGDFYLNINLYPQFISIMDARLEMCRSKGFSYVEFDVMDAYQDGESITGFSISRARTIAYVSDLVHRTNAYGMQAIQKNADDLSSELQPFFGAVLFEECIRLNFCAAAAPYVAAGKPALNAEYPSEWRPGAFDRTQVCRTSSNAGVATIITTLGLDAPADRC
jgi:hypothetical protein